MQFWRLVIPCVPCRGGSKDLPLYQAFYFCCFSFSTIAAAPIYGGPEQLCAGSINPSLFEVLGLHRALFRCFGAGRPDLDFPGLTAEDHPDTLQVPPVDHPYAAGQAREEFVSHQ